MAFNGRINKAAMPAMQPWVNAFSYFSLLPVPLFILANFSKIMQKKSEILKLLVLHGVAAGALYVVANLVSFHFGFRAAFVINPNSSFIQVACDFADFLSSTGKMTFMLNIFIDLFLFTSIFFFLSYRPSTHFQDKKLIIFRLFVIFPLLYDLASVAVKFLYAMHYIRLPSFVLYLLPSKPPIMIFAFLAIIILIKIGERAYLKREGNTPESYDEHLKTNAHSFKVSIIIAVVFLVASVIDLVVGIFASVGIFGMFYDPSLDPGSALTPIAKVMEFCGIGDGMTLFAITPIVLLFSYTKKHKNAKIDLAIPVIGIIIVIMVYIEGLYDIFLYNMSELLKRANEALEEPPGSEEEASSSEAISSISKLIAPIKDAINSAKIL